ncbi:MAG: two-component sensor histidine kinase, partial [Clostridium sp.]|nr:two-component sensor histidine kinase [Clostridium sp.]
MRRAILKKFIQLLFLALALNTVVAYIAASSILLNRTRDNMMFALETVDVMFAYDGDLEAQEENLEQAAEKNGSRYTLLTLDGKVLVDTGVSDEDVMDNHREREEIAEALHKGKGSAVRHSDTLGKQMLYVALLSSDGRHILRLAAPYSGMLDYMKLLFPAVFLSFVISFLFCIAEAGQFSQTISSPLAKISQEMLKLDGEYVEFQFEKCPYEEINVIAETTMRMSRNMKEKQLRLEQERQIRQEFFSNASHELKTPITSIRGYVELLESGMALSPETSSDFLKRIKKETMRMTSLVDDILMISRLESGGAKADIVSLKVRELMEEAVGSLVMLAAEHDIIIHTECKNNFTVQADRRQMTELFTNLIGNAVKYNNDGGSVWVKLWREERDMVLTVRDNGVGIPE